ncbi:DNA-directed RNA polymerase III subunit rpc5 [Lachnellula suecica]|uniref:DNA-directed RNA polymerase III subunit rpc5 n=1 Tax=Lachnellula suecica TaxID=602035 RepID=A0A8T9C8A7_9HELO|nr:DNA-directed RNA polymerase III subunit rpc5 [Lachnellula suecica]
MEDVEMAGVGGPSSPENQKKPIDQLRSKPLDKDSRKLDTRLDSDEDEEDEDDDPIVMSYDMYIKPQVHAERQFVVMQFPNRDSSQPYNEEYESAPQAIRMKPKAGMFEMDVPIDPWHNYDRLKGIEMGGHLNKSNHIKGVGSHGLAGGFGIGAQPTGRAGRQKNPATEVKEEGARLQDFAGAVERHQVLRKQTLGGQSVAKDGIRPQYMIGVFRENQLHLTPVDHLVQMRPQFHHVDAAVEAERRDASKTPAAARPQEARAVHLTAKSAIDGEEENDDTMAERIAAVQAEQWKTFRIIDENSNEAWKSYDENMFVGHDKGLKTTEELRAEIPKLSSVWNNAEYLDALAPKRNAAKVKKEKTKTKGAVEEEELETFDLSDLDDTEVDEPDID